MQHTRATAALAVVRIICVLGMSFAIAAGIFILLWGKILLGLAVTLAFLPFFYVMRRMEKLAIEKPELYTRQYEVVVEEGEDPAEPEPYQVLQEETARGAPPAAP